MFFFLTKYARKHLNIFYIMIYSKTMIWGPFITLYGGILPWSQYQINNVWTHTQNDFSQIIQSSFLLIFSLLLKKYFFMYV